MTAKSHRPRKGEKGPLASVTGSRRQVPRSSRLLLLPALLLVLLTMPAAADTASSTEAFLAEVFGGEVPAPSIHWLSADDRQVAAEILGHEVRRLRQRFWVRDDLTAFVLDEIGKEKPITVGVAVDGLAVDRVQVLVYREDRGGEVRYPFFTDQFRGARLDDDLRLDQRVDGISGATLSVRALVGVTRLALYLQEQILEEAGND